MTDDDKPASTPAHARAGPNEPLRHDADGLDEMVADGLSVFDVEHCILTGRIIERQRDRDTGEWKYVVAGKSLSEHAVAVVAKIASTGKLVFITVYLT